MTDSRTKRLALPLAFALACGAVLLSRPASAVEARLSDDASVQVGSSTNLGGATDLRVQGPPYNTTVMETFIKFDLSALTSAVPSGVTGSDVEKATLTLFVDKLDSAGSFAVKRVTSGWVEGTINGTTMLPALGSTEVGAVPVTTVKKFVSVDLTTLVKAWLDGSVANNGVALVPAGGVGIHFDSKEATS